MQQHPLSTRFIAKIEMLAHRNDCFLWAMDSSFTQELYLSGTFNRITKREVWELYQNQSLEDFQKNFSTFATQVTFDQMQTRLVNPKFTVIYSFILPKGGTQLVLDRSFHFNDAEGKCQLIAGVAVAITQEDLADDKQEAIHDRLDKIALEYYRLLALPFDIKVKKENDLFSKLTKQQQVILKHILHGFTAKEIAKKMNISFRTVEFHTNSIKRTLNVNTKSELINLAISLNHVAIHL